MDSVSDCGWGGNATTASAGHVARGKKRTSCRGSCFGNRRAVAAIYCRAAVAAVPIKRRRRGGYCGPVGSAACCFCRRELEIVYLLQVMLLRIAEQIDGRLGGQTAAPALLLLVMICGFLLVVQMLMLVMGAGTGVAVGAGVGGGAVAWAAASRLMLTRCRRRRRRGTSVVDATAGEGRFAQR